MANTLDDFSDQPLSNSPQLSEDVQLFVDYLDVLATGDDTAYAGDTLRGMAETVKRTAKVTDAQRDAVANIVEGAKKHERSRQSSRRTRRYEGRHRW